MAGMNIRYQIGKNILVVVFPLDIATNLTSENSFQSILKCVLCSFITVPKEHIQLIPLICNINQNLLSYNFRSMLAGNHHQK